MGSKDLFARPTWRALPAGSGLTSLRLPFGLPTGSLSLFVRLACVQNVSDPSAFFNVEGWLGRLRKAEEDLGFEI